MRLLVVVVTYARNIDMAEAEQSIAESSKRSRSPSAAGEAEAVPAAKKQATEASTDIPTVTASTETASTVPTESAPTASIKEEPAPKKDWKKGGGKHAAKAAKNWKGKGDPTDKRERNGRDWDQPRPKREGAGSDGEEGSGEKRLPKKKVAVLIG